MTVTQIRVGIIGANPSRGWAHVAHIPALQSLDQYRIAAVATRSMETAMATAAHVGGALPFDNIDDLLACPDVDLVVITVKVPAHYDLVKRAIEAGKHVYCEWPLTLSTGEAEELLALAKHRNVRHMIGLQARLSAPMAQVRDLLETGYIGTLLSSTVIGSGFAWGGFTDEANAYVLDARSGATMLTVPAGHFLDAATSLLGKIEPAFALIDQRRKTALVIETGEMAPSSSPDQIIVGGRFECGAPLSIHFRGGLSRATNLHWELNGTDGDLVITNATGHIQMSTLAVMGARGSDAGLSPLPMTTKWQSPEEATLPQEAQNVRRLYEAFASDLRNGTAIAPTFETAIANHQLIDQIRSVSVQG